MPFHKMGSTHILKVSRKQDTKTSFTRILICYDDGKNMIICSIAPILIPVNDKKKRLFEEYVGFLRLLHTSFT